MRTRYACCRLYSIVSHVSWGGGLPNPPGCRSPLMQTILDANSPGYRSPLMQIPLDADPPGYRTPCMQTPTGCRSHWMQIPLDANPPGHVTWDACWEANLLPLVDRMTDTCKNTTLPQTSFADGNKYHSFYWFLLMVMKSAIFFRHLGQPVKLSTTVAYHRSSPRRTSGRFYRLRTIVHSTFCRSVHPWGPSESRAS